MMMIIIIIIIIVIITLEQVSVAEIVTAQRKLRENLGKCLKEVIWKFEAIIVLYQFSVSLLRAILTFQRTYGKMNTFASHRG
jgi:hypothetical protein